MLSAKGSLLSENKLFIVFGFMNLLSNITINVSIVQQNQPCKTYMRTVVTSLWMNFHLNKTIVVSIVQQNLPCKIYMKISVNRPRVLQRNANENMTLWMQCLI